MHYKLKFDLTEYVSVTTTENISISFNSVTNQENFVSSWESAYGLTFNKSSSLTNVVIYAGGSSVTLANSNVTNLSATNDYVIFEADFDYEDFDSFMWLVTNNIICY